jgi:hypothetical protein
MIRLKILNLSTLIEANYRKAKIIKMHIAKNILAKENLLLKFPKKYYIIKINNYFLLIL